MPGMFLAVPGALAALVLMLARGRAESPAITRAVEPPSWYTAVPWVLLFHPAILFLGFVAYMGSVDLNGVGLPGIVSWALLWPLAVEVASLGHPSRVARMLRSYANHQLVLPLTADHRQYQRLMRPLRATETKLFLLIVPVVVAGFFLSAVLSEPF